MSNGSKIDRKRKSDEPAENEIKKSKDNKLNNFIKEHSKELYDNRAHIATLSENIEKFKVLNDYSKSTIEDLKESLVTKNKAIEDMTMNNNKLQQNFQNLKNNLLTQNKKLLDLECAYEKKVRSLSDQLQCASSQLSKMNNILNAKEAECAVYLKDMRTQLEQANSKIAQSEEQINELRTKVSETERTLQACKEEKDVEIQNLTNKFQNEIERDKKKLDKNNKRISSLQKKLLVLKEEKKALKNSLDSEGHKIRELQRVLSRPVTCTSPACEVRETNERQINQVEPLQEASSSSSRPATPQFVLETQENPVPDLSVPKRIQTFKPTVLVRANKDNGVVENESRNQTQESQNHSISTNAVHPQRGVRSENHEPVPGISIQPSLHLSIDNETSDDAMFPSYFPNKVYKIKNKLTN